MRNSGFTVVEMLVSLAILAILLSIGVPNFKGFISSSNMVSNSNDMVGAFSYARMAAIKRGGPVRLGVRDGSSWTGGIVVWVDADADATLDAGEELRLWDAFNNGSSIVSAESRSNFVFNASGEVNNDDVLTLCDNRTGEQGRSISILLSGVVFAEEVSCG